MLPIYLTLTIFLSLAFIGLFGALDRKLIIRTTKGNYVNKKGKKAIVSGGLFFAGMSIVSVILLGVIINRGYDLFETLLNILITTSFSLGLALLHRKLV